MNEPSLSSIIPGKRRVNVLYNAENEYPPALLNIQIIHEVIKIKA
jgi:hypothetical protein